MYMYYVPDLDILCINLYTPSISYYHGTKELDVGVTMDLNKEGNPTSFQIEEASEKYSLDLLQKVDWSLPLISAEEAKALLGDEEVSLLLLGSGQNKVSPKDVAMILQNRKK